VAHGQQVARGLVAALDLVDHAPVDALDAPRQVAHGDALLDEEGRLADVEGQVADQEGVDLPLQRQELDVAVLLRLGHLLQLDELELDAGGPRGQLQPRQSFFSKDGADIVGQDP
jgi:hypothetical protein